MTPLPASIQGALAALRAAVPGLVVEVRQTKRSLLGLRRHPLTGLVLRVHPELLNDADCSVFIPEWIQRRGRGGPGAELRGMLQRASTRLAAASADASATWASSLDTIGSEALARLGPLAQRVHATWFADLPPVPVIWGRRPPGRRLTHLRFGCYRRQQRRIELTPRLAQPWVATVFIEHVLHHEYCHHRQASSPQPRREGVHSPRFRSWEHAFPGYAEARRWETLALPWLLDDSPPPWYRPQRSTP